jgi:hypothetical protein
MKIWIQFGLGWNAPRTSIRTTLWTAPDDPAQPFSLILWMSQRRALQLAQFSMWMTTHSPLSIDSWSVASYSVSLWCVYRGQWPKYRCPYKTSPHKTSPHITSPHKTSPHKTSPVTKRHPTKRHLAQNVTSTKRHQKTSPVTNRHLIVPVSTMRNNASPDIIAVGTMRNPPVHSR